MFQAGNYQDQRFVELAKAMSREAPVRTINQIINSSEIPVRETRLYVTLQTNLATLASNPEACVWKINPNSGILRKFMDEGIILNDLRNCIVKSVVASRFYNSVDTTTVGYRVHPFPATGYTNANTGFNGLITPGKSEHADTIHSRTDTDINVARLGLLKLTDASIDESIRAEGNVYGVTKGTLLAAAIIDRENIEAEMYRQHIEYRKLESTCNDPVKLAQAKPQTPLFDWGVNCPYIGVTEHYGNICKAAAHKRVKDNATAKDPYVTNLTALKVEFQPEEGTWADKILPAALSHLPVGFHETYIKTPISFSLVLDIEHTNTDGPSWDKFVNSMNTAVPSKK